ncbi:hypothetical protein TRVA0_039S01420 [Trichomonascus vanleenenianus]|uniref:MFS transporter n=1 Tax=Trichomonascus vanleenenianus TaxID=2268995 RepID=UPI003EC9E1BC
MASPTEKSKEIEEVTRPDIEEGQVHLELEKDYRQVALYELDDDVLTRKMFLVNEALNEIGFTPYHFKLFCLNGMGYAADSLLTLMHSVVQAQVNKEFNKSYATVVTADYAGLFAGALFWGFISDVIGRRIAFHTTLFITAIFAMAAAGGMTYAGVCAWGAMSYFGAGGNLVLDSVTFLEFLPYDKQWMVTFMAIWWGFGQLIPTGAGYAFMPSYSCETAADCTRENNMGWRYVYLVSGGSVLIAALLRVFVIRMCESPKYDLANGKDERVIETLNKIAASGNRVNPLKLEDLQALGTVKNDNSDKSFLQLINPANAIVAFGKNAKGAFATKKLALSMALNMLSWALNGMSFSLFTAFLPTFLQSRGAKLGDGSLETTFRDNLIVTVGAIIGPCLATPLAIYWSRRGTMFTGSVLTMTFMFAFTAVKTPAGNLGFNFATNTFVNMYYGTLYAYTPEVMPSNHRSTGNGIAVCCGRIMSAIAPVIAYYGNPLSSIPVYVMASSYGVLAIVCFFFPFEVKGKNSM